jgi:hypothetical protein
MGPEAILPVYYNTAAIFTIILFTVFAITFGLLRK